MPPQDRRAVLGARGSEPPAFGRGGRGGEEAARRMVANRGCRGEDAFGPGGWDGLPPGAGSGRGVAERRLGLRPRAVRAFWGKHCRWFSAWWIPGPLGPMDGATGRPRRLRTPTKRSSTGAPKARSRTAGGGGQGAQPLQLSRLAHGPDGRGEGGVANGMSLWARRAGGLPQQPPTARVCCRRWEHVALRLAVCARPCWGPGADGERGVANGGPLWAG